MATSSRAAVLGGLAAIALAGCGAASANRPAPASGGSAFAWLTGRRAPASWPAPGRIADGALPRPPGWRPVPGDCGSVSFARTDRHGVTVGYLNATPRSRAERLTGWSRFRVRHNAAEGDRDVRAIAGAQSMSVGAVRASCVIDDYRTSRSRYREIACLVSRPHASTVVVGAAPPGGWGSERAILERAISGFVAG